MRRFSLATLVALSTLSAPLFAFGGQAQQTPAGVWRVQFVTPLGDRAVTMTINVSGNGLTGHVIDEYGEYPLQGHFADEEVTAVWSVQEDGKPLDITMKGILDGNVIRGTARLGDVGEGSLVARRVGDAGPR